MTNNDVTMDDDRTMTKLATDAIAAGLEDVSAILIKVIPGMGVYKESIRILHTFKSEELARTYAFILDKKQDEEEVIKLTKEGLEVMIMHRLKQLMPDLCKKCNKVHYSTREEVVRVACRLCGVGACLECYPAEEAQLKWFYLCNNCDHEIVKMRGDEALEKVHLKQKKLSKKKDQPKTDESVEKEEEPKKDEVVEEVVEVKDSDNESEEEEFEEENKKRGFKKKGKKEAAKKEAEANTDEAKENVPKPGKKEKKDIVCSHFRKARCFFGMSGKTPHNGVARCPYKHPSVCQRLLRHGDRGRAGCRGHEAGCKDFHPRMCYASLNTRMCSNLKECTNGYHIRGTTEVAKVTSREPEGRVERRGEREQENFPSLRTTNPPRGFEQQEQQQQEPPTLPNSRNNEESNTTSFLGQILLQQQQMFKQQQDQQKEQQNLMRMLLACLPSPAPTSTPTPTMSPMDAIRMRMVGSV